MHLADATFESSFVDSLPGDPVTVNRTRQVHNACYSFVQPTAVSAPRLVGWSVEMAAELGFDRPSETGAEAEILAGNRLAPGMKPYAACYGGHQFGSWAGQLGDGRAITLGERIGKNGQRWELALKGAGPTPYSRRADGRAVLRSSLREFICSEAMHHLGVPTTRALSLTLTGDTVVRDMFYDGHPQAEPGAIVSRVAPSFVRFGNFEIFASRDDATRMRLLADYVIRQHFPDLVGSSSATEMAPEVYLAWFNEIAGRTAAMIVHWLRVGFVHGVMNTDNMSVLGLTIDYGPFGWLDIYDPNFTPNTTDAQGRRYRFGYQGQIAQWNLAQFASALLTLVDDVPAFEDGLARYRQAFTDGYRQMMHAKLGLTLRQDEQDPDLIADLLECLTAAQSDPTRFYRELAKLVRSSASASPTDAQLHQSMASFLYEEPAAQGAVASQWIAWLHRYFTRAQSEALVPFVRAKAMDDVNPWLIPRNFLLQEAIDAATLDDWQPFQTLAAAIKNPYGQEELSSSLNRKMPEWARDKPGCSALSCSS